MFTFDEWCLNCSLDIFRSVVGVCRLDKVSERASIWYSVCLPSIVFQRERLTRHIEVLHDLAIEPVRHRTIQYAQSFMTAFVDKWNRLINSIFPGEDLDSYKFPVNYSLFSQLFYLFSFSVWYGWVGICWFYRAWLFLTLPC